MSRNVFDVLKERGYIAQLTDEEQIREILGEPGKTFYIGFDPTADSLHVGHYVQMMVMHYLQQAGHRPIALMGGGTGMIGDPSGRSDLRQMMTVETIDHNVERFVEQMGILVDFSDGQAIMANNADWLRDLNYIEFIREIGSQFSVNRMLATEAYKQRLEHGLTFLEFNYMLLQAYDYLTLYRKYDCILQVGGDDQWSNILAGIDLVRRKEQGQVYGMTMALLETSEGIKMGKTAKGAVWLDAEKTSPFDFYQYWRNIDDADVTTCLRKLTFVPMEDIKVYDTWSGSKLNEAKTRLAIEVTRLVHGEEAAVRAQRQTEDLFGGKGITDNMPQTVVSAQALAEGKLLMDILVDSGLVPSRSEGRRNFTQGGISLNDETIEDFNYELKAGDFTDGEAILRRGKKKFHKIVLAD